MPGESPRGTKVDVTSLSDEELRQLRREATQEMRRRGILPAKEGQQGGVESGKRKRNPTT